MTGKTSQAETENCQKSSMAMSSGDFSVTFEAECLEEGETHMSRLPYMERIS